MKVAIVGCGRIGRVHAAAVRQERGVSQLVLCDPALGWADGAAVDLGGTLWRGDVDGLLGELAPDVVHVCTPPATHAAFAARALQAGAHVLVEKPMALGSAESARIASALRGRAGQLCVDHNFLFEPDVTRARRWIGEGRIGRVFSAHVFYGVEGTAGGPGPGSWAQELPGGRFTDLLPHPLYLAMHFLGEMRSVSARTAAAHPGGPPSELSALLACERGLATVEVSLATVPWELSLTLRGTAGTIRVDLARQQAVLLRPRGGARPVAAARMALDAGLQGAAGGVRRVAGKLSGRLRGYPGLRALIARFYASVREGAPPPVTFADGAATAAALERIRARLEVRPGDARRADSTHALRRLA